MCARMVVEKKLKNRARVQQIFYGFFKDDILLEIEQEQNSV
jgi:hypothetical protein